MKTKRVIKVKDGRAYLHWETKIGKLIHEGVTPLGADTNLIKRFIEKYSCKVEFLS